MILDTAKIAATWLYATRSSVWPVAATLSVLLPGLYVLTMELRSGPEAFLGGSATTNVSPAESHLTGHSSRWRKMEWSGLPPGTYEAVIVQIVLTEDLAKESHRRW